jgi:RNA recognition motif-containing protein
MNIYVGNLSYEMSDDDLRAAFEVYGEVSSARILRDKENGRSRGYGFVEMPNDEHGEEAIKALDNSQISGRNVKVNQARPRSDDAPRARTKY